MGWTRKQSELFVPSTEAERLPGHALLQEQRKSAEAFSGSGFTSRTDADLHDVMEDGNLSSPAQVLRSPPFCLSSSSSDTVQSSVSSTGAPCESALIKLSSNLQTLIFPNFDDVFSDVLIYVSGRAVPVHRCVLAARCPYFRTLFSKDKAQLASFAPEQTKDESTKLKIDLNRLFDKFTSVARVGYDAFMAIMGFFYSGRLSFPAITCIDDECLHESCRPVVQFAVEMLSLSSVLNVSEVKILWQHHLYKMMEKAPVDESFPVLIAAEVHGVKSLVSLCKWQVANSKISTVDIEKQLPLKLAKDIIALRLRLGLLQPETLNAMPEKECKRIQKALDSDDIELVKLLLKEGRLSLDEAHALHYAASYCDPRTVQDILELGLADPNLRDNRGFNVLHVASMRRDPVILVALLLKGANPLELTPDGRSAFQLCRRLIRSFDHKNNAELTEEAQNNTLSVKILDQAGRNNPFADGTFPPVVGEKQLFMRLLYLENRVAVARLLFPQEAKLVMGISHLDATSEFTGLGDSFLGNSSKREVGVDLNKIPLNQISLNQFPEIGSSLYTPAMNEALLKRVQALQKTVELARQIFPRCFAFVNNFMDDFSDLSCIEKGSPEEQLSKKRRYSELKVVVAEAFRKDVAAMDRHKPDKSDVQRPSPSLPSSKQK